MNKFLVYALSSYLIFPGSKTNAENLPANPNGDLFGLGLTSNNFYLLSYLFHFIFPDAQLNGANLRDNSTEGLFGRDPISGVSQQLRQRIELFLDDSGRC